MDLDIDLILTLGNGKFILVESTLINPYHKSLNLLNSGILSSPVSPIISMGVLNVG